MKIVDVLPSKRSFFYGGSWVDPIDSLMVENFNPSTGESLGLVPVASDHDVDKVVSAARKGFHEWRQVQPLERARIVREMARIVEKNSEELALLDSVDGGNPVTELKLDQKMSVQLIDFFAGLVTEMKGTTVPAGLNELNLSIREPVGVVVRINPFNHPFMFNAAKAAAPLVAGNSIIVKPPEQAPLSGLRLAELLEGLFPAGVFNVITGGTDTGRALSMHQDVAKVALIGSVETGKAVLRSAAETIKPVLLELGGKNALIAFPDSDPKAVAKATVTGMNFGWCGQSCGSTSRSFIHKSIYKEFLKYLKEYASKFEPGIPSDPNTTMGALISKQHLDRVMGFIKSAKEQGAVLVCGGKQSGNPILKNGFFVEPTIFTEVTHEMRIANEEIFGPVHAVSIWDNEEKMLKEVNGLKYGLTCSIWTNKLQKAHQFVRQVEAGYIWVNEVGRHFLGTPFGGQKQSSMGREECLEELLSFTQEKHIHFNMTK